MVYNLTILQNVNTEYLAPVPVTGAVYNLTILQNVNALIAHALTYVAQFII